MVVALRVGNLSSNARLLMIMRISSRLSSRDRLFGGASSGVSGAPPLGKFTQHGYYGTLQRHAAGTSTPRFAYTTKTIKLLHTLTFGS